MRQELDMETLSKSLLDEIGKKVNSPETLQEYRHCIRKICSYFTSKGFGTYEATVMDSFITDISTYGGFSGKVYCKGYQRFLQRVARIFRTYAEEHRLDYSTKKLKKRYPVSEQHRILVENILLENNLEGSARKEMEHVIRMVFWFVEKKGLCSEEITDEILMEFLLEELPKTVKGTIGRSVRGVKMMAAYLTLHGIAPLKRDISVLSVKGNRERMIKAFSLGEIQKMVETIEAPDSTFSLRDKATFLLAADTGLRCIDVTGLTFDDIDWKHGTITLVQSKTKLTVSLPVSGKTLNAIADYILRERPKSDSRVVFLTKKGLPKPLDRSSLSLSFRHLLDVAGVEKIDGRGFHSLRRSFATEMARAGAPLETISQMLGHRSIGEDKPYLTFDVERVSFLTFGFSLVPIEAGFFSREDNR